ncbi:MAG TPA: RluA family pseudouridine synthase [Verrucomicrobiae bacterium]|nr:RluA family pseudouridine synthase [Verrucomicrobiae bacterium]
MARPNCIELFKEAPIPILYEDRSVLAIDKPAGWMLVPFSWQRTQRNLQAAITSSIGAGHYWARSRNLRFLKYVHRLDAETTGILLFAKSQGALDSLGALFETRQVEKIYLAVSARAPCQNEWTCNDRLAPDPEEHGRMRPDRRGKDAETAFRLVASAGGKHLIEARPRSGRQHQIRIHLALAGCPIVGDELYGGQPNALLGLRAVGLAYRNPFTRRPVAISASTKGFLGDFGFGGETFEPFFQTIPPHAFEVRQERT